MHEVHGKRSKTFTGSAIVSCQTCMNCVIPVDFKSKPVLKLSQQCCNIV